MGKRDNKTASDSAGRPRWVAGWQSVRAGWRAWLTLAALFALSVALLAPRPRLSALVRGGEAAVDVRPPELIAVTDERATDAERQRILTRYDRWWSRRSDAGAIARARLEACFEILTREAAPTNATDIKRINDEIKRSANVYGLSDRDVTHLMSEVNLERFRGNLREILDRTLENHFIVRDFDRHQADREAGWGRPREFFDPAAGRTPLSWGRGLDSHLQELELRERYYRATADQRLVDLGLKILKGAIDPDLEFDRVRTEQRRDAALAALEAAPIRHTFRRGDPIALKGEALTPIQLAAVTEVLKLQQSAYPYRLVAVALMTLLCYIAIGVYLGRIRRQVALKASNVAMVALPPLLAIGAGRLLLFIAPQLQIPADIRLTTMLFPSALVGILGSIMLGAYSGFSLVLVTAVAFGLATGRGVDFQVLALFSGFSAVAFLHTIRERKDVLNAGLRVGLISIAAVGLLALFRFPLDAGQLQTVGREGLLAFGNAVVSAAVALPLIVIFERAFGVVTDIRLLELTGPHHPLIRMMEERAPGTYQHVLNVTKLAESAAEAIGANYLLVRAGAYFHDVGKALKPKYFTENQVTFDDKKVHSRITPYMSVLIIKNHVKEGIELSRKHGLPEKIVDFIPQHHGTSLIRYFYNEALRRYDESESTEVVREEDFRYPGPKPQSIETAIVLLADSVEAIATSTFTTSHVNENDLRRTVAQATADRFHDGQFDECDLTMRALSLIRESFVQTLKARYHQRIAYPAPPKREPAAEPRESAAPPTVAAAS